MIQISSMDNNYSNTLNIFYEEPDPDRWIKYDRFPRKIIRRIYRGHPKPGGVQMISINLLEGLKRSKIPYRFNDYSYIKKHPDELACVIGKAHVLFEKSFKNPVLFGAGIYSHPIECVDLFVKHPEVKHVLVPGEWMRKMFAPYYHDKVSSWPTGIDTLNWIPYEQEKKFDFLIYNKIRWEYELYEQELLNPIKLALKKNGFTFQEIIYGNYEHLELKEKLRTSKAAIFLCEHETQGIAYQQILSTDTPILAWDRGGFWKDPYYYPDRVQFEPVSSVPYWDSRCGLKFSTEKEFTEKLGDFAHALSQGLFNPRDYILENLTLEKCALEYYKIANSIIHNNP